MWLEVWKLRGQIQLNSLCLKFLDRKEKIIGENALETKENLSKLGLKFNPGLDLIDLRTIVGPALWVKYRSLQKKEEMNVNSQFLIIKAKIPAKALHRREETETECYNCALIHHLGSNIISFSQESKD